jgi:hypothetical protein
VANYYLPSKNHFALTSPAADTTSGLASGDIVGFTCIPDKEKGNAPFYKEIDGQYLVNLFSNSQADPTAKNPEEELPILMDDFRSGFGMNIQDYLQPKRYYSSFGCDLSVKGTAMAGWTSTAITLTSYGTNFTIVNGDMELTTGWTGGDGRSATQHHGGSYSWLVNNTTAYQELTTWNNKYRKTYVKVTGWIYGNGASGGHIDITDGVGTTASSTKTVAEWATVSVTRQLDSAATKFQINLVGLAGGACYFDDVTVDVYALSGTLVAHTTFNNAEYIGYGNILSKMNATGDGFDAVGSFPANITNLTPYQVSGTDYLFIFLGTSESYWYMSTTEVLTQSSAVVKTFQFATWVNTTADTMYANDGANTIRCTTNPLNGGVAWSTQTIVGTAANAITHLQEKDGALLIDKVDRPYYLSSTGTVQKDLAPECDSGKSTHSGKNSTTWQGEYYRPTGDQALLRSGATNEWIQPSKYATNSADFTGQVEACAGDEEWLYVGTDNSTKIEIQKTREEDIDGTLTRVWHPIHELTLTGIETMWISTVYQKRLWIASTSASDSLYYLPLPTKYGDITNDSNRTFKTGTYWETPYLHGRFMTDTKGWLKVVATLGHAYDADICWTIQYKKLQDSSYTNTGNLKGTATDRTHTLYIPVDGSSNNPISTMMRFKLIAVTDDTAKTPILNSLDIRAILYPTKKDIIWAKVKIAKEMTTMGGSSNDKYAKMKACLDKCRDATYPVTMKDIDGNTVQVRFLQLPQTLPFREPVTDEAKRDYDYIYNILLLKTPTS